MKFAVNFLLLFVNIRILFQNTVLIISSAALFLLMPLFITPNSSHFQNNFSRNDSFREMLLSGILKQSDYRFLFITGNKGNLILLYFFNSFVLNT